VRAGTIILAVGATAVVWGCGSEPRIACTGRQTSRDGPACTPGAGLRLTGTGASLRPVWRGYFDARGPRGWARLEEARPGRVRVVRRSEAPAPVGSFTVHPGDLVHKGQRAELVASVAHTGAREGEEAWYAWSTFLPADVRPVPRSDFNVITQFHGTSPLPCSPSLQVILSTRFSPARVMLLGGGGPVSGPECDPRYKGAWDLGPARLGHWENFVLHVIWSASPDAGLVELSRNGQRALPPTRFPTLYEHQRAFLKQGFYRDHYRTVSRVYQTGVTRFTAARD
jgi:hypothetical protein